MSFYIFPPIYFFYFVDNFVHFATFSRAFIEINEFPFKTTNPLKYTQL